jgi:hypothetical protein
LDKQFKNIKKLRINAEQALGFIDAIGAILLD